MYPEADVPCIQLSLVKSFDPKVHIKIGEALSGLEYENLLVIGSGFSFHNMKAFFAPSTTETKSMNETFEQWLIETCSNPKIDEIERTNRLVNWQNAPSARYCHPREEHLLPLHVGYGVAKRACREFFDLNILGKKASVYLWWKYTNKWFQFISRLKPLDSTILRRGVEPKRSASFCGFSHKKSFWIIHFSLKDLKTYLETPCWLYLIYSKLQYYISTCNKFSVSPNFSFRHEIHKFGQSENFGIGRRNIE